MRRRRRSRNEVCVSQSEITRFPPGETKTIIAARHGTTHEREGGRETQPPRARTSWKRPECGRRRGARTGQRSRRRRPSGASSSGRLRARRGSDLVSSSKKIKNRRHASSWKAERKRERETTDLRHCCRLQPPPRPTPSCRSSTAPPTRAGAPPRHPPSGLDLR